MSGGSSADSDDAIYPAFGLYFLGCGDGDFSSVGNDPPRGLIALILPLLGTALDCLSLAGADVNCPPPVNKAPGCRSFFPSCAIMDYTTFFLPLRLGLNNPPPVLSHCINRLVRSFGF